MSCEAVRAERFTNERKVQEIAAEKSSIENRNVAVGTVGAILFWPALFALDLSDAEEEEMSALNARNAHLLAVEQQNCYGNQPRLASGSADTGSFDGRSAATRGAESLRIHTQDESGLIAVDPR